MICGALQTLNEEAFEDVVANSERPSPTGGPSGEQVALTPIQETAEHDRSLAYSNDGTTDRLQLHTISFSTNISSLNNNNNNRNSNNNNINDENNGNHTIIISNKNYCTVVAATEQSSNNIANNKFNHLAGLNVHEPIQSQSQSYNQTNPMTNSPLMLDHIKISDNGSDVSDATVTPSSTIILMPDPKSNEPKPSINDTRL